MTLKEWKRRKFLKRSYLEAEKFYNNIHYKKQKDYAYKRWAIKNPFQAACQERIEKSILVSCCGESKLFGLMKHLEDPYSVPFTWWERAEPSTDPKGLTKKYFTYDQPITEYYLG